MQYEESSTQDADEEGHADETDDGKETHDAQSHDAEPACNTAEEILTQEPHNAT